MFSARVGPKLGVFTVGVKRLVAPAVALRDLPKIDLIVLSHAHFDHFDIPSLRRLENRGTTVVTAANTADLLRVNRYRNVRELGWGARAAAGGVEIRAFPVTHWRARMRRNMHRGYNGYTIEAGRYRVLFGGDTALTNTFRPLRSSRSFDLAIMPLGACNPWIYNHCTPEQSWRMANDAGAEFFFPVYHQHIVGTSCGFRSQSSYDASLNSDLGRYVNFPRLLQKADWAVARTQVLFFSGGGDIYSLVACLT